MVNCIANDLTTLDLAANDTCQVQGATHNFYRYPARFSPIFAKTAIDLFSKPGDIVLDPYMGGGTTIVEAMLAGRVAIGVDLNSLACFITKVKTTKLNDEENKSILNWSDHIIPRLNYHTEQIENNLEKQKTKNLNIPRARFIKKIVSIALAHLADLPSRKSRDFVRCAILKTSQWALDGRKTQTSLSEFREKLFANIKSMLDDMDNFINSLPENPKSRFLFESDSSRIDQFSIFSKRNFKVDLVVTSPPYPGLHILYHRWQVDGRKETPAPYWIAACNDGQGDSYYNFGSRHQKSFQRYFETSLKTLKAIRNVMKPGATMIQMVAFSNPEDHLPRYLENMSQAGFQDVPVDIASDDIHISRLVPNRKWHATFHGITNGSKEFVLIHKTK